MSVDYEKVRSTLEALEAEMIRKLEARGAAAERSRLREQVEAMRRNTLSPEYRVAYSAVLALLEGKP